MFNDIISDTEEQMLTRMTTTIFEILSNAITNSELSILSSIPFFPKQLKTIKIDFSFGSIEHNIIKHRLGNKMDEILADMFPDVCSNITEVTHPSYHKYIAKRLSLEIFRHKLLTEVSEPYSILWTRVINETERVLNEDVDYKMTMHHRISIIGKKHLIKIFIE